MAGSLAPGERCYVDVTSPLSLMFFPVAELLLWTGVMWVGIGAVHRQPGLVGSEITAALPPGFAQVCLIVWLGIVLWRFVLPLVRGRMWRFMVTNERILYRPAKLRGRVAMVPIEYITRVERNRKTLVVHLAGQSAPLVWTQVPKSKLAAESIEGLCAGRRNPLGYSSLLVR